MAPELRGSHLGTGHRADRAIAGPDHHHKLTLARATVPLGQQLLRSAAQPLLELLGQLAGQHHPTPWQDALQFSQQAFHPEGGFVEDQGSRDCPQFCQTSGPLPGFVRQEAREVEGFGRQSAGRQTGHQRAGSGNGLYPKPCGQNFGHDAFSRIADSRRSGVGHQGHGLATAQSVEDLRAASGLIETEIADHLFSKPEVGQQLAGVPGVFGGDHRALPKHPQRPEGDVLQVSDGCGHQVQRSGNQRGRGRWGGLNGARGRWRCLHGYSLLLEPGRVTPEKPGREVQPGNASAYFRRKSQPKPSLPRCGRGHIV